MIPMDALPERPAKETIIYKYECQKNMFFANINNNNMRCFIQKIDKVICKLDAVSCVHFGWSFLFLLSI